MLLEGNDATTSAMVQARHSYTFDDVCWDATFAPCTARFAGSGGMSVDFTALHSVLQLGTLHAFRGAYARGRSPLNSFDNSRQRSHSQPPARTVIDAAGLA